MNLRELLGREFASTIDQTVAENTSLERNHEGRVTKVTVKVTTGSIASNIGAYLVVLLKQLSSCGVVVHLVVVLVAVCKVFLVVLDHM